MFGAVVGCYHQQPQCLMGLQNGNQIVGKEFYVELYKG